MRVRIIEPTKSLALKRKRVCAYARVSSGSETQGESLENQTTGDRGTGTLSLTRCYNKAISTDNRNIQKCN